MMIPALAFALLQPAAQIKDPRLTEISGIDASYLHAGVHYVHNDSGDSARFFAIDLNGKVLAEYKVKGATARDWEDMTTAPCGKSFCLYIADIGDNAYARKDYRIYEIREPEQLKDQELTVQATYAFTYEKGESKNAEGFAYNPMDGYFYLASKGENALHRFPRTIANNMIAYKQCSFSGPDLITSLDFSEDGEMLVRTYSQFKRYTGPDCTKILDASNYGISEKQGEAVAYLGDHKDGFGFVSVSEGINPRVNVIVSKKKDVEPQICNEIRLLAKQNKCNQF